MYNTLFILFMSLREHKGIIITNHIQAIVHCHHRDITTITSQERLILEFIEFCNLTESAHKGCRWQTDLNIAIKVDKTRISYTDFILILISFTPSALVLIHLWSHF